LFSVEPSRLVRYFAKVRNFPWHWALACIWLVAVMMVLTKIDLLLWSVLAG
jgi:hypothetical protein